MNTLNTIKLLYRESTTTGRQLGPTVRLFLTSQRLASWDWRLCLVVRPGKGKILLLFGWIGEKDLVLFSFTCCRCYQLNRETMKHMFNFISTYSNVNTM